MLFALLLVFVFHNNFQRFCYAPFTEYMYKLWTEYLKLNSVDVGYILEFIT